MSKRSQTPSRAEKRARFAQAQRKARRVPPAIPIVGALMAIAAIVAVIVVFSRPSARATAAVPATSVAGSANTPAAQAAPVAATSGHAPFPLITAENGIVQLPLATLDDHQAHFYTYMREGRPIEFFAIRDKNGLIHTAFDACDVCFPAKRGYHQEGNEMVCNNCGRRFPIEQIGQVSGGCNPAPLRSTVAGDTLTIPVENLIAGLSYF